ncbi:MAG TPA: peptide chain release factor 2 [Limnochordia bacterium]
MRAYLDIEGARQEVARLEERMGHPDFWADQAAAQAVARDLNAAQRRIERWEALQRSHEDALVFAELAAEEDDPSALEEAAAATDALEAAVHRAELQALLSGEHDPNNAILAIHPGAGGTEAQDWAEMLLRMYTRWAERRRFGVETLDYLAGDEAGIKSVTLLIKGENAYGYLKAEKGVHRLVRISPFDASGRRHTSFASVDVLPEVTETDEIEIDPSELRIDTYRSSGAGGQHVNKTESAIRITHLPTGIVVTCQSERSQHANREAAMGILRARLLERRLAERQRQIEELRGEQSEIAWGSQIRSYVFCPYTLVKDHRTGHETANVDAVMDGEIDPFIEAYLERSLKRQAAAR